MISIILLFLTFAHFMDAIGSNAKENVLVFSMKGDLVKLVKLLENSTVIIQVVDIPLDVSSITIQAHAHTESLLLSYSAKPTAPDYITGQSIGLFCKLKNLDSKAQVWLFNNNPQTVSTFLAVTAADGSEPIPGGCNMEFPTEVAPYLKLLVHKARLNLEYQHANMGVKRNVPSPPCGASTYITYDTYVLFLKENDYGQDEYFDKISKMSNLSSLKKYSTKVQSYSVHPDTRLSFLKYPNVGAIYNIVARSTVDGVVKEAPYIPVGTYGCDFSDFTENGCKFTYSFGGKAFLFILSIYGFIVSFFGHKFFGPTILFFAFLSSFFIGLVLIGRYSALNKYSVIQIAAVIGLFIGTVWFILWLKFQIHIISYLLIGFVFGFLLTATAFYTPLGNFEIFMNDKNYWGILCTGTLLVTVIFLSHPNMLTILGSSIVGSYMMLLFYDDYIGTRLAYVILNVIKRAISEDFGFTSNDYPFQAKVEKVFSQKKLQHF
ncbi:transmembrane 7 superfamily member 3-like isoform X2 [Uloborus diversus]|uniref:transmembrane 7 superfamily member 3-like isoform X2 n=1 Tax=Uloborus diversus TaxID=327109 RepID=UPI002409A2A6|nr:transmembrane 7 superfamily member 3-like isoform X2 [Uloborus diversus]